MMSARAKRSKDAAPTVILEVSPRAAKVMVATTAPFRIQRVNASTLPEQTEDLLKALRVLLESQPLGARQVGVLFGREAFSLRTLELPSVDPKEIASMLDLQLGKLTPYPRADILSAWTVIGSFREAYTSVLLAITRKALIEEALQLLKTKGVASQWVGLSTEGLESWWAHHTGEAKRQASGPLAALIDVDFASTDCAVFLGTRLIFTHSIAIGHDQLSASDQGQLRWLGELARLPRILLHEDIKGEISRSVLTGVTHGLHDLVEQLAGQWGVGIEVLESLAPFAPSEAVSRSAHASRVSYTALAGVAASGKTPRIDLIPQEMRVSQALQVRSKRLARLAGSLAALLVLAAVLYLEHIVILRHYLAQLQQHLASVEQASQQVMQRQAMMRTIRQWVHPARSPLEVIRSVASTVDPTITITQLAIEEGEPVTIRGKAGTMAGAFAFFNRLEQQDAFASVHANSVTKAKGPNAEGAEFMIVCELSELSE